MSNKKSPQNAKKHLQNRKRYGMLIKHDCDRYAMKREVAANWPVFPWSMSDFKPGEKMGRLK
jgi:hypothetical protein